MIAIGRFEDALDHIDQRAKDPDVKMTSRHLLMAVCLAHHLKLADRRDDYLNKLIAYPPEEGKRLRFALLGDLFQQALTDGKMDLDKSIVWAETHDGETHQNWKEYVPWFMAAMGDERGKQMLFEFSRTEAMGPNVAAKYRALSRSLGAKEADIRPTNLSGAHELGPIEGPAE